MCIGVLDMPVDPYPVGKVSATIKLLHYNVYHLFRRSVEGPLRRRRLNGLVGRAAGGDDDNSRMDFDECTFQNEAVLVTPRHAVHKH